MSADIPYLRFDPAEDGWEHEVAALTRVMIRHPVATQAAFNALVHEGRRFADSDDGRVLRATLARSPLFARFSRIWEVLSGGGAIVEDAAEILPSVFVDALAQAARSARLEQALSAIAAPEDEA
jgi:hypothetical protein